MQANRATTMCCRLEGKKVQISKRLYPVGFVLSKCHFLRYVQFSTGLSLPGRNPQ